MCEGLDVGRALGTQYHAILLFSQAEAFNCSAVSPFPKNGESLPDPKASQPNHAPHEIDNQCQICTLG